MNKKDNKKVDAHGLSKSDSWKVNECGWKYT